MNTTTATKQAATAATSPATSPEPGFEARLQATRECLQHIVRQFSPAVFASSLAAEDMVLTDLI